ncbi:MAG: S-layer homology domain-containing protein [Agathobaculum sp.]|uniref:hemoblobin-interacting domain-containing protein n=1 Tax=Agathobaculum sp. TaxID=2048138 RepID=UPI002A80390B|nr:S-layer homology domain-containing protein [Agathobaculum sp.]MDY3711581.1 S-layer homology domain-containing protein [Agathobaculum sp.]
MTIKGRMLGVVVTAGMVLSMVSGAAATDGISGHWAENALKQFIEKGYFSGDGNGDYMPDGMMSRAQLAATLNRIMDYQTESDDIARCTDVPADAWYRADMAKALAAGYMRGTSADTMSPEEPVTREQALVMIARVLGLQEADPALLDKFSDVGEISAYAKGALAALVQAGYITGNANGQLQPRKALTRAEGVSALSRSFNAQINSSGAAEPANSALTAEAPVPGGNAPVGSSAGGGLPSKGSSGGSSSSGSSGGSASSGGSSSVTAAAATLVDEKQTKLVKLGWIEYVAITFAEGYSKESCTVTVDGVDVTAALQNVTTDGSIAKWEVTGIDPAKLTVHSKSDPAQTQTVILSNNPNPARPAVAAAPTAPAYLLAHGTASVWDYHLTNYDASGQPRVSPARTTFALDGTSTAAHRSYSPDAVLKPADNSYGVSGEVEILFNYNTDAEKAWFDSIAEAGALRLLQYDERLALINDKLSYTKESGVAHGKNTVGRLTIPLPQSNFYSNGRYYVSVAGSDTALVSIHVVNETVPSMQLKESGAIMPGKNVHFKVSGMVYGVTMPIECVTLTDPSGETRELVKLDDWYLIGDTFVLYNDVNNNTPQQGVYTVTAYSNGFQPMSKSFTVTGSTATLYQDILRVDAVSRATTGGSTGSGESGSGGSGTSMTVDLLFNADLLTNALILNDIGVDCAAAAGIAKRWQSDVIVDAVFDARGAVYYDWTGYYTAVSDARLEGRYLTFADYAASDKASVTPNRPYAVREVLEDNLLGAVQHNGGHTGLTPPALALDSGAQRVPEGSDAVLVGDGENWEDYLRSITAIHVNSDWQPLPTDRYSTEGGKLMIGKEALTLGENRIEIKATGYKRLVLGVAYEKAIEQGLSLTVTTEQRARKAGSDIVLSITGSAGDFLNGLQSVTLNDRQVLTAGQGGSAANDYYEVSGDKRSITLKGGCFRTADSYTVVLRAAHYDELRVTFSVAEADPLPPAAAAAVPAHTVVCTKQLFGDRYQFTFTAAGAADQSALESWINAISGVAVNSVPCGRSDYSMGATDRYVAVATSGFRTNAVNTVVISAEQYADLVLTVTLDAAGSPVKSSSSGGDDGQPSVSGGNPATFGFMSNHELIRSY